MRIGLWWVDTYTLRVLAAGAVALVWLTWRLQSRRYGDRSSPAWMGWGILGVVASALVVGRLAYVLMHLDYFRQHPETLVQFKRTAGIEGIGALIGGLGGLGVWAAQSKGKHTLRSLLGLMAPVALWIAAGAWWARQGIGEAWGRTPVADGIGRWWVTRSPDLYHMVAPRYAVQVMGMVWAALTALLAWALGERRAGFGLALYLGGAAALTLLRGDPVPLVRGVRVDTLAYAGLAVALAIFSASDGRADKQTDPGSGLDWGTRYGKLDTGDG